MSIKKFLLVGISSAVLLGAVIASRSAAQVTCECTHYVANRFGLSGYPDAGDWDGNYLTRRGFVKVSSPQAGAIVVMERSFPGANSTYGHVGIIESVRTTDGSQYLDVRGSNQRVGGSYFTEAGCNNVRITRFGANVRGRTDISYWVRSSSSPSSPSSPTVLLELRATPPSGTKQCIDVDGTKIGVLPDADKAKVGNCAPIQEQQFRMIDDGNGFYRFELRATPLSGTKQCLGADGTKVGVIPNADIVKVGNCAPIQEHQFRRIDDGNGFYRFELRATPPSGTKQCLGADGTKVGVIANANILKVGNCAPIQEHQFRMIQQ